MPTGPPLIDPPTHCAVLAGGLGRRIGGSKPLRTLAGRPLISFPIAAARQAGLEPLVVAKPDTALAGVGAPILREPTTPRHPLAGIVAALRAVGAAVVVCPCDLPLLEPRILAHLAALPAEGRPWLIASPRGPEPLLGIYPRSAAAELEEIVEAGGRSDEVVEALGATLEALGAAGGSERSLLNVNDRDDLAAAVAALSH